MGSFHKNNTSYLLLGLYRVSLNWISIVSMQITPKMNCIMGIAKIANIHYLHKSHNTPLLPPKNLHRDCFRLLLGHFHVPGEIANNCYTNVLGGNRGVLWDCASSEYKKIILICQITGAVETMSNFVSYYHC